MYRGDKSHSAIQAYFDSEKEKAKTPEHLMNVEKARAICCAYSMYYRDDGFETVGIEIPFCLPMYDPETNAQIPDKFYSGIIDAILRRKGVLYFCDHKTAVNADWKYFQELKSNPQLTQYLLAAKQAGYEVDGFVWDVVLKPSISPKKLTKVAKSELETEGTYCGYPVSQYNGEEEETPELYGIRVFVEYTERPEKYFIRQSIKRTDEQLLGFLADTALTIHEESRCRQDPRLFLKNLGACKAYGTLCEYHQLCAEGDTERYQPIPERDRSKDPTGVIKSGSFSPSRIGTFHQCRRKYQLRYVEKIEAKRKEYEDSTEFGTLFHSGMEVFLQSRLVPEDQRIVFPITGT